MKTMNIRLKNKSDLKLPSELKMRLPMELEDGHGSYICESGHLHDYSRVSPPAERDYRTFETWEQAKEWLNA